MKKRSGAALCLLTAAVCLAVVAADRQSGMPLQPSFRDRSLGSSQPVQIPNRVKLNHTRISEQSLLIRDLRVLDSPDFASCKLDEAPCPEASGKWSFASVFQRGMAVARKTVATQAEVQDAMNAWRGDMKTKYAPNDPLLGQADNSLTQAVENDLEAGWKDHEGNYPASRIPVKLLAIVNRMDTAVPDPAGCAHQGKSGKDMNGAEIRLEFAGVKAQGDEATPDYLRLIVEFVLPCESSTDPNEFPRLARDWYSLAALDIGTRAYGQKLSQTLDYWLVSCLI